jgi:hypothetical protein
MDRTRVAVVMHTLHIGESFNHQFHGEGLLEYSNGLDFFSVAKVPTERKMETRTMEILKTVCSMVRVKWFTPMAIGDAFDGNMANLLLLAPVPMQPVVSTPEISGTTSIA